MGIFLKLEQLTSSMRNILSGINVSRELYYTVVTLHTVRLHSKILWSRIHMLCAS